MEVTPEIEVRIGSCAKIEVSNGNHARKEARNGISLLVLRRRAYASVRATLARIVRLYFFV